MELPISALTGVGKLLMESPSRRCTMPSTYCQYLAKMFPVPSPSSLVSTWSSPGGTGPAWDILVSRASTGLPGIS